MTINHGTRMSMRVCMHILTKHMRLYHVSMEELNVYLQQLSYIANHATARANNACTWSFLKKGSIGYPCAMEEVVC